LRTTERETS